MSDYPPPIRLRKLYRRQSAKGAPYVAGKIGGAKIAVVKSSQKDDDGAEIWSLLLSEAPQEDDRQTSEAYRSAQDLVVTEIAAASTGSSTTRSRSRSRGMSNLPTTPSPKNLQCG